MTYLAVKALHVTLAVATVSGFILRGIWMLNESAMLQHRVVRIAPHLVDMLLLISGALLLWLLHLNPLTQSWLLAKFAGLIVYILLGTVAIKRGSNPKVRKIAFIAAVATFGYVVGVAVAKSPFSWIGYLGA